MTFGLRSSAFLSGFAAAALFLVGCNGEKADTIRIGEYASLSGKEANYGNAQHEGIQLAFEQVNTEGGVLRKKIELLTDDDASKAGEASNIVNKLISKDDVVAVLGEVTSGRSLEAAPICQQYGVPMVTPAATNPRVTQTGDYIFRVCFIDSFQGSVMVNFAKNSLHAKKVAIFTDIKSDYSKGLAEFFRKGFTEGGEIVAELDYSGGDKDFKAQLTTIKNSNPDAVFVPGHYTDVALIRIQSRQLGLNVPFLGGDGWEGSDLLTIGKEAVEGDYFSSHYSPDRGSAKAKSFVEAYQKRWGKTPGAIAALSYDAAMILADAIRRADRVDRAKIREALAATKDFEGVTGKITMNEHRDAVKSAVILQIKNGVPTYLETIEP